MHCGKTDQSNMEVAKDFKGFRFPLLKVVGNKVKGRISKRMFQENTTPQIDRKTNISYPLIRTRTCSCQGVRHIRFSEKLTCYLFS